MISFLEIVYNLSLFKMHPYLYYKNELTFFSAYSYTLTVLFAIGLLFIIMLILGNTEYRIISSKYDDFTNKIDFTDIPLLFKLIDKNGKIIEPNERIFKFNFKSIVVPSIREDASQKNINKNINFINCSYDDSNIKKYFYTYNLSEYICTKNNNDKNIYGKYLDKDNGYKYYIFQIEKCINNLSNNFTCDVEGLKRLENSELIVEFLTYKIYNDEKNNENVKLINTQKTYPISINIFKKYIEYLNGGYYEIKGNKFMTTTTYIYNYFSSYVKFDFEIINENTTLIQEIIMASQGEVTTITKEYTSILQLGSYIGGWVNLLFLFLELLNKIFYIRVYKLDLFSNFIDGDKYAYKKFYNQFILYRRETLQDNRYIQLSKEFGQNIGNVKLKIDNKKSKIIHLTTKNIKSKLNYIIPYCCFRINNNYLRFFIYDKILSQYLSLESIFSTVLSVDKSKNNQIEYQPILNKNVNKIPILRGRDNNSSQIFNQTRDQFIYNVVNYNHK